ncbi:MAG TPA: hypothetical protein PKL18_07805, partial [Accumulibacter sp.]|nr:hypothetical protein [Accumulibacter sp.]
MWAIPLLSKLSATLSWLLCCLFLASTGAPVIAAESAHLQEATLHYHFRPIVTFRTTLMGMTPETRVRRALARLDTLAANQMGEPVEVTPFTVDGKRGINLRIGQLVLFNVLEGDLDPEEKLSIDETGRRAASEMQAALQAAREQNRPMVLLKGAGLSILATAIALLLLWLIRRATTLMVRHLQVVIEAENASSRLHWARHGWLLVQRLAQLL